MRLTKATAAQKIERDRLAHAEWGQRLSVEQFLEREARLRAHAFSREGMTTWLLVDERSAVLSSCETFRMESAKRGGAAVRMCRAISARVAPRE